jgi:integrase
LVKKRRLAANPVLGIDRLNNATDVRHPRRALTPSEFAKLVRSAEESTKSIQCFDGRTRGRIYILSYMTGLRRSELASLTPRSFNLQSDTPTVTVQATISKHRRKDVLPLHPDLVDMLSGWLKGLGPDEPLFPKLARRRTWLMVKKDLERVGIPYVTPEGIADFHAAGRHTHITELLRNGASLPEAKELARHTDVKMTMRYAHIGIEDQARALRGLPVPRPEGCQDIVRKAAVSGRPGLATAGSDWQKDSPTGESVTRGVKAVSGVSRQKKAPPVTGGAEWRRRESNPRPV